MFINFDLKKEKKALIKPLNPKVKNQNNTMKVIQSPSSPCTFGLYASGVLYTEGHACQQIDFSFARFAQRGLTDMQCEKSHY